MTSPFHCLLLLVDGDDEVSQMDYHTKHYQQMELIRLRLPGIIASADINFLANHRDR